MSTSLRGRSPAIVALAVLSLAALVLGIPLSHSAAATATSSAAAPDRAGRIVWTQDVDPCCQGGRLVSARPDGTGFRVLTHPTTGSKDLNAAISPDGSTIAFERDLPDGHEELRLVGSDGRSERLLDFGCTDPCFADAEPGWAPNGREILFTRVVGPFNPTTGDAASAVLYAGSLNGSNVRRVSQPGIDGVLEDGHPRFAPHGRYLMFLRLRDSDLMTALFRMRPDGSDLRQLTPYGLDGDLYDISQAVDGPTKDLVVFETAGPDVPDGKVGIATVPATCHPLADCRNEVRFLSHDNPSVQASFNPTWSPAGDQIAFTIAAQNTTAPAADIWRMRADGTHPRQVSHAPQFEFRPAWAPAAGR
jgi:Tol biopolymer transport system component